MHPEKICRNIKINILNTFIIENPDTFCCCTAAFLCSFKKCSADILSVYKIRQILYTKIMKPSETEIIRKEIREDILLCDTKGCLNSEAVGWSRFPYQIGNLKGRLGRKKKWDYWAVTTQDLLFSMTVADLDYANTGFCYFFDKKTGRFAEKTVMNLFPRGFEMPLTPIGKISLNHPDMPIEFQAEKNRVHLKTSSKNFGGKALEAEFRVERPPLLESLNVVVPWDRRTFQYTSKQHCMPTEGTVKWGDEIFQFKKEEAFSVLDFGRGIWPYQSSWNWAAFSGRSGKDIIGLNMGSKWTDGTGMNENGILLNGRLHKIFEEILFDYDPSNFMKPWNFRTENSDTVSLQFRPLYDRKAETNALIIRSSVHQLFGEYFGTLNAEGRTVRIEGLFGWAEEHYARW